MGVLLNHAVAYLTSPLSIGMTVFASGVVFLMFGKRRTAAAALLFSFAWTWLFSTGLMFAFLGGRLEKTYPPRSVESLPPADAVVLLGGGAGSCTNALKYAEMYSAADRVAHVARIVKAGKARFAVLSGDAEEFSSLPLLLEYGVPREAVILENKSRNTEENVRFAAEKLRTERKKPKIILVTSSWHMRRALLLFSRYAGDIEVIPAAADYEALVFLSKGVGPDWFFPSADALFRNTVMLKECIGYWGYRLKTGK